MVICSGVHVLDYCSSNIRHSIVKLLQKPPISTDTEVAHPYRTLKESFQRLIGGLRMGPPYRKGSKTVALNYMRNRAPIVRKSTHSARHFERCRSAYNWGGCDCEFRYMFSSVLLSLSVQMTHDLALVSLWETASLRTQQCGGIISIASLHVLLKHPLFFDFVY